MKNIYVFSCCKRKWKSYIKRIKCLAAWLGAHTPGWETVVYAVNEFVLFGMILYVQYVNIEGLLGILIIRWYGSYVIEYFTE